MIKTRVKIFVSTKGVLLQDYLNKELETLENDGYQIVDVKTNISYAGSEGYQTMGTIIYEEWINDFKTDINTGFVDFCPGEPAPTFEE